MEVTGSIYDDVRQGDITETNARTIAETKNPQTKISDSTKKWASRIFTATALVGWMAFAFILLDGTFNHCKLIITVIGIK